MEFTVYLDTHDAEGTFLSLFARQGYTAERLIELVRDAFVSPNTDAKLVDDSNGHQMVVSDGEIIGFRG